MIQVIVRNYGMRIVIQRPSHLIIMTPSNYFLTHIFRQTRYQTYTSYVRFVTGLLACCVLLACDSGAKVANTQVINETQINQTQVNETPVTTACIDTELGIAVCPASDMAKITRSGFVPYEHTDLDWSQGAIDLHGAKNETIAVQFILTKTSEQAPAAVELSLGSINNANITANAAIDGFSQAVFSAFYHPIDNAGYTWGPPTSVLPWPDEYPDALIPIQNTCQMNQSTGNPSTTRIALAQNVGDNQAAWIDTYIDTTVEAGTYNQTLLLTVDDKQIELPVTYTVYDVTLPDKPSINAVGELYRTYILEGSGVDISQPQWRSMAHCYQQLAHQHRMVFIERLPDLLTAEQMDAYTNVVDPILSGELFTAEQGYTGPGVNTPVAIWRTPWPQDFDIRADLASNEIQRYRSLATLWDEQVVKNNWRDTDYFAYLFDEVDGPGISDTSDETADEYIARVHQQMADVQSSIDEGSGSSVIDLIWTSHSNPAIWKDQPGLDLTGTIRLWSPNAGAADTQFLKQRIDAGEQAWFYHHGHPAVGAHSINVSGIEMRTWGVIGARYGFQGQLMWAVNLGSNDFPYRDPQFNPDEDRAGNGVLVYPGNQLDKIGFAKAPGPVPSMRLKAWRRGLQDAELYFLARKQSPSQAKALLTRQMPSALTEGQGNPSWSSSSADWIDFHKQLLNLATE